MKVIINMIYYNNFKIVGFEVWSKKLDTFE